MGSVKIIPMELISQSDNTLLLNELRSHGVLLVRSEGEHADLGDFEKFTQTLASSFTVHGNPARSLISDDGFTQEVDAGTHALPPHSEMTYMPFYPDTMWFYCVQPPQAQGETTVFDGVEMLERLSVETREFLQSNRLKYKHIYPRSAWSRTVPVETAAEAAALIESVLPLFSSRGEFTFFFDDEDNMHAQYLTSAISTSKDGVPTFSNSLEISFVPRVIELRGGSVEMEDGTPMPQAILDEISVIGKQVESKISWQKGDILMIDNTRVMHGRRSIVSQDDRQLFVRLGNRH
ncbi:TauD/TfdA family dioxygenase [Teredinibacter waterburyi]|uniref:TauD/TfdA family dioxygenase n=1 Tax=Teredinibacter waterburyi TaxID=1500538 RepID=UPI00165F1A12|nr:TauD/TfdA family dioxygenase [Teredinibacter waterburyi]